LTPPGPLDRAGLERLYVKLERRVYNVVFRWVWNAEEAHEIVQEAFVRLWAMRARVRPATVEPLVYRIALNMARNRRRWLRIRRFFGVQDEPDPVPTVDARMSDEERTLRLRSAVDALPEPQRVVILLTQFSELSYREVADILDIPEGTVGSRRNHALRALRDALGEVKS
jgi:RNA polymerase sigma-70 factor (ECF subfamily)